MSKLPSKPLEGAALDQRWRPALMAFFRRRVRNPVDAEDLTQETLLRLLRTEQGGERADAYVFQVAQNLLIDRARRDRVRDLHRQSVQGDPDAALDPIDPSRIAEGRSEIAAFMTALDSLPERTRTIFILYRLENMSQDAIGQSVGISASAVKQQVAKAMAILVKAVREGGG